MCLLSTMADIKRKTLEKKKGKHRHLSMAVVFYFVKFGCRHTLDYFLRRRKKERAAFKTAIETMMISHTAVDRDAVGAHI